MHKKYVTVYSTILFKSTTNLHNNDFVINATQMRSPGIYNTHCVKLEYATRCYNREFCAIYYYC